MKRKDTMSLGEFRELTKDMPDHTALLLVQPTGFEEQAAVALQSYPFCTSLDSQDVFLFQPDVSESARFVDC